MTHPPLNRRELVARSFALMAVPLCCSTPRVPDGSITYNGSTLVLDLGRAPELRRVGAARAIIDEERKLNLIVAHVEKKRFIALDRSCTHGGGQCAYDHKRRTVRCTSLNHAEYSVDGVLLHGRTHGNLRAYAVRLNRDLLEIAL